MIEVTMSHLVKVGDTVITNVREETGFKIWTFEWCGQYETHVHINSMCYEVNIPLLVKRDDEVE